MTQTFDDLKSKYDKSKQKLEEVNIAYSNLLHDVLSFNELISKKNNTYDILILTFRLARSIIDFNKGAIFRFENGDYTLIHSLNLGDFNFKDYEQTIKDKKIVLIPVNEESCRIVAPLTTKQQPIGILDIVVALPQEEVKQQDLDLLWILLSIAAIEFESLEMSNRTEILSLMLSSLEKINSEDKLDNLLYLILNNIKQIVPAANYLLILRDKLLEVSDGINYCIPEIHSLDETCCLVDEAIRIKETIFIKSLIHNPACQNCTESYLHNENNGSLMLVPLYKGDIGYGVIVIFDKDEFGNIFTSYNRHIIEIFAKQATIAINNAILYDKQKKTNQSLAKANDELSLKNTELDESKNLLLQKQQQLLKAHDEVSKWNKVISKELEAAGVIQSAILSKHDVPENLEIDVLYRPHHSIGGDYFGVVALDEYRTAVYIGDVSGKGVPAAITTGFLKNEFNYVINKLKQSGDIKPSKILSEVNQSAFNVFRVTEQFTSTWCGIIDSAENKLVFASAGHDYPLLINDNVECMDYNNCPIIGLSPDVEYKDFELDFGYTSKLFLYTDGLTDQEISTTRRLSRQWLIEHLDKMKDQPPKLICYKILEEVQLASKGMPQHDDMLVIIVSCKNVNQG